MIQAQALAQSRSKSQVSGPSGVEEAKEDASIANSTIKSGGTIPLAPPFATINVPASVQGAASGGGLGPSHVATGSKTMEEMLFSAAQDTPDWEIERETGVILPRDERGRKGTNNYKNNQAAATKSIELKFGVAKHYVSSLDGKAEKGDATKIGTSKKPTWPTLPSQMTSTRGSSSTI